MILANTSWLESDCYLAKEIINWQLVNTQNYVFYFESDIAKVYPFRPTCSFFDSERKTKSKGELKRTRKESEQIWQTWINSMGGFFVIFIWNYHYSTQLICTKGMN
jgi:hypothetical protein